MNWWPSLIKQKISPWLISYQHDWRGFWLSLVKSGWSHVLVGSGQPYALHHPQMSPKEEALHFGIKAISPFLKNESQPIKRDRNESKYSKKCIEEDERLGAREQAKGWSSLIQRLRSLPAYQAASVIATYLSFPHEVDTSFWLMRLKKMANRLSFQRPIPKRMNLQYMIRRTWNQQPLVS